MFHRKLPDLLPEVERAQARACLEEQNAGHLIRPRLTITFPHLIEEPQSVLRPLIPRIASDQNVPRDGVPDKHFVKHLTCAVPGTAGSVGPHQRGGQEGVAEVALGHDVGVQLARVGEGAGVKAYSSSSTTTTTRKQASPHPASHRACGRGRRRTKQASPRSAS